MDFVKQGEGNNVLKRSVSVETACKLKRVEIGLLVLLLTCIYSFVFADPIVIGGQALMDYNLSTQRLRVGDLGQSDGLFNGIEFLTNDSVVMKLEGNELDVAGMFSLKGHRVMQLDMGYNSGAGKLNIGNISGKNGHFTHLDFFTNEVSRMMIDNHGNVGIGTTTPQASLDITNNTSNTYANSLALVRSFGADNHMNSILFYDKSTSTSKYYQSSNISNVRFNASDYGLAFGTGNPAGTITNKLIIRGNGNVGIGTSNPESKLSVNGKITAEEIKVIPNVVPDFVFEGNYKLASLSEVEEYINANKHLPEIPSAQVIASNGGVNVGEMQMKLLQKVEELTLYMIEQSKETKLLKKEVAELRHENKMLNR